MRHWQILLFSLTMAGLPIPAVAQNAAPPAPLNDAAVASVMEKAVDNVIRPGYRDFRDSAKQLTAAVTNLCAAPSQQTLDAAKGAYAEAVDNWSRIEIVQIGPVIEDNRFEHILFYPDRKGVGLRQIQALIAKADEKDTTMVAVAGKSVAVQGLGALEYVLFGTGSEALTAERNGFRCRYGAAVAGNIEKTAGDLVSRWEKPDGVQAAWKRPGPDSEEFMDSKEAMTALLGILVHGTEMVRDQRLEAFYKGDLAKARPKAAIYWRSGNTWNSVAANIEGLQTLWEQSGMRDLLPHEKSEIAVSIDSSFRTLRDAASGLNPDIEAALANERERRKIDTLLSGTKDLIFRLNDQYGGAIGLAAGFSFSDGD
ncbi:imelysin family protein [Rhizobium sp. BK251]|uniref:imelysin family protein n=1 Tax=Rhizobium sp. BK251 TaxID=2512125 RepID=UPI0010538274|nr:imelysin family protein [Rhizobium sp. BK251]TCL72092.1 hypothetical protein EV286_105353 [Rhizobium sp. BK251]